MSTNDGTKLLSTPEACKVIRAPEPFLLAISARENIAPDGVGHREDGKPDALWSLASAEAIRDILAADMAKVSAIVEANPGKYAPGGFALTADGEIRPVPLQEAMADRAPRLAMY